MTIPATGVVGEPVKLIKDDVSADIIGKKVYIMLDDGSLGVALGQPNNMSSDQSLFTEFTITDIVVGSMFSDSKVTLVSPDGYYITRDYGNISFTNTNAQAIIVGSAGSLDAGNDSNPYTIVYEEGTIKLVSMSSLEAEYPRMFLIGEPGHDYGELIPSTATCEEGGFAAHYECSVCDKIFDADKNETTLEALVVSALGHAYGDLIAEVPADCENDGVAAHYHCEACDKYFDADKHETTLGALTIPATGVVGEPVKLIKDDVSADIIGKKVYIMLDDGSLGVALGQPNNMSSDQSLFTEFTITDIVVGSMFSDSKVTLVSPDGYYITRDYGNISFTNTNAQAIIVGSAGSLDAGNDSNPYTIVYEEGTIKLVSMSSLDAEYLRMFLPGAPGHDYGELIPEDYNGNGFAAHYECSVCHKLFDEEKHETTEENLRIKITLSNVSSFIDRSVVFQTQDGAHCVYVGSDKVAVSRSDQSSVFTIYALDSFRVFTRFDDSGTVTYINLEQSITTLTVNETYSGNYLEIDADGRLSFVYSDPQAAEPEHITYYLMYNESTGTFLLSSTEVGPYVYLFLLPEERSQALNVSLEEGPLLITPNGYARSQNDLSNPTPFVSSATNPYLIRDQNISGCDNIISVYQDDASIETADIYIKLKDVTLAAQDWASLFRIQATNTVNITLIIEGTVTFTGGSGQQIFSSQGWGGATVNIIIDQTTAGGTFNANISDGLTYAESGTINVSYQ